MHVIVQRNNLMPQHVRRISAAKSAVILAATLVMAVPAAGQQPSGSRQNQQQNQNQQNQQNKQNPSLGNQGATADIKDVTRHPEKYINKAVTVEGETVDVLGPHLFVVDAPKMFHLWGGMVVVVPEPFAAVVRRDAPVRVTGTVQKVVLAEAKRKWAFLSDPKIEVDLFEKPVIVANEVTTVAPAIVNLRVGPGQSVGTAGSSGTAPVSDLKQVAVAVDTALVGRRVDVSGTVTRTEGEGFWIRTPSGEEVFVVPATKTSVGAGQMVELHGTVLETPTAMKDQTGKTRNQPVYIYADQVVPK